MKQIKVLLLFMVFAVMTMAFTSCANNKEQSSDQIQAEQTEQILEEANRQIGMPAIINFQEKRNLKWIYELCDKADFICHAYLFNSMTGEVGQYLGKCIGYGIPYSTQFSNPEKIITYSQRRSEYDVKGPMKQAEPNGLFKPEGLSATWLIMIDPNTNEPTPVYVEPEIIVSPFRLDV